MRFLVYKNPRTGLWRFTNFRNIGGDCDTWREAYDEAYTLTTHTEPTC